MMKTMLATAHYFFHSSWILRPVTFFLKYVFSFYKHYNEIKKKISMIIDAFVEAEAKSSVLKNAA